MPLVRDIKNRDSKKTLVIQLEESSRRTKKLTNKKIKKSDEYLFFVKDETEGIIKKPNKEFIRMLLVGFFIVFMFNIAQIGFQLFSIASDTEVDAFQGFDRFVEGGKDAINANFGGAVQYFDSASFAFKQAQDNVWFIKNHGLVSNKDSFAGSAYSVLEAGEHISSAASYFSQGASAMQEIPILFMQDNIKHDGQLSTTPVSLTEKLKSALELFDNALAEVKLAQKILPKNLNGRFKVLASQLNKLIDTLMEMEVRVPAILSMLGDRYPHRYLILLQNNSESRPTGGFIGSFLIVDINDGHITKADFHDVYDYDGQLQDHIDAPKEIDALTDNWRMRDANYSPDFAVSAKKIAWFLEKEGGPGVDTVIAINQSILKDLLGITGPLSVEGLSGELTDSNYQTILTYIVESKLEGKNNPKAVIGRIVPSLREALSKNASIKSLFTLIGNQIRDKDIMAWSKDEKVQKFFDDIGVSGRIKKIMKDEDYFNLVSISVGGNKSDRYMDSSILHETIIDKRGEIRDVVTYKRSNTFNSNVVLEWKSQLSAFNYNDIPKWLEDILGAGENKSVIKILVPKGSELENVIGVSEDAVTVGYDKDTDKSYMYFTLSVPPGQESVVTITYKLPYKLDLRIADEYNLTVQKQPGALNDVSFVKKIIADSSVNNYRSYPEEVIYTNGKAFEYKTSLKTDLYFSSLWGI